MEQWLILSNVVNYAQYERKPKNFYDSDIKADRLKDEDRKVLE